MMQLNSPCLELPLFGTDSERIFASADNWNWLFGPNGQKANRVGHLNGWVHPIDNSYTDDNNDWHIYQLTIDNQDRANAWFDATQVSSQHRGAHDTNYRPKLMQFSGWDGKRNNNRERSQCQIAEFIAINRVVPETERLKIEGYLAQKWGLMSTMFTASHPYFSTDPFSLPSLRVVKMRPLPFIGEKPMVVMWPAIGPTTIKYPVPMGLELFLTR